MRLGNMRHLGVHRLIAYRLYPAYRHLALIDVAGSPMLSPLTPRSARLASGRDTMHGFKIGQYVYYVPRRAEGRYVVMRLLPQPKGDLRYIIRSQADPEGEYTAEASELRTVPGAR